MSRRTLLLVGGAAALLAAALIAVSIVGGSNDGNGTTAATNAAGTTGRLPELETTSLATLEGIPQNGLVLGRPSAAAVIVEYADLQCPFCAKFSDETLPDLVDRWVKPGKATIDFRGLAVLGPDSERALRFVLAAAEHDKAWSAIELLYENQGEENSGWVTDDLLRAVARELDLPESAAAAASSTQYDEAIAQIREQAARDEVAGTPSFFVGRQGGTTVPVATGAVGADAFEPALTIATGS